MPQREQVLKAAADLEMLADLAKQIVLDLRKDAGNSSGRSHSYARVYDLRTRLTKIVATLGYGRPSWIGFVKDWHDRYLKEG